VSNAFKPILARLASGEVLSEAETETFFAACLRGEPTPAQIASAVTALRVRGETVPEIAACARAMREAALPLVHTFDVVDTCGTGGDGAHTFNISTAAAIVAAGGGVKVAKHGGRAVSSLSGSPDVFGALGVDVNAGTDSQLKALDQANICVLFAPNHHRAMRHVAPVRAELGFRTLFNLLGPLSNPAGAKRQLLGVFDPKLVEPLAEVLGRLGATHAWVVHGDGLDELTTTGQSVVAEWKDGMVRTFTLTPELVGLPRADIEALRGGDPATNARAITELLDGAPGPYRDIVLLNAAAVFVIADRAADLSEGLTLARQSIDSGAAKAALARLVAAAGVAQ
jgi:anthranilate phosphoribosyltransferase